ncbi:polycystic kidney disease protein 1-like 3 [Ctenocephalides felis]|uniref:polycystic kidney disease protein 1-like 3 n=1 Tax=Ctenocephalides felis TaxID=7515 RepID=UPI000E6E2AA1|nr:polycystic kidney disease protein 1-like 3 [Ctenocephalides felis]
MTKHNKPTKPTPSTPPKSVSAVDPNIQAGTSRPASITKTRPKTAVTTLTTRNITPPPASSSQIMTRSRTRAASVPPSDQSQKGGRVIWRTKSATLDTTGGSPEFTAAEISSPKPNPPGLLREETGDNITLWPSPMEIITNRTSGKKLPTISETPPEPKTPVLLPGTLNNEIPTRPNLTARRGKSSGGRESTTVEISSELNPPGQLHEETGKNIPLWPSPIEVTTTRTSGSQLPTTAEMPPELEPPALLPGIVDDEIPMWPSLIARRVATEKYIRNK